ncbi:hypothetical protein [Archangium violaceum]|uniref:hypothetical protein n=1 Tax=Archangium violaceum TaxID=83451 RepID=UPI0023B7E208|nr:hypothetical protein [Archangium violaceum]
MLPAAAAGALDVVLLEELLDPESDELVLDDELLELDEEEELEVLPSFLVEL